MTTTIRSGIPTTHRHTNFRSRLEARWAAFFDLIGWSWVYEPLDVDGYIPDFLVRGERSFFVEVGPCIDEAEFRDKAAKADRDADQLHRDLLVVGVSPVVADVHFTRAGWFGEIMVGHDPAECGGQAFPDLGLAASQCDHSAGYAWDWGHWHRCRDCGQLGVHHSVQSYASRPCGHYDGGANLEHINTGELEMLWNVAGNRTQWLP